MRLLHRLFFACQPTAPCRRQAGLIRDGLADVRDPVADHRLHVTLAITADFEACPAEVELRLLEIGGRIAEAPFRIVLDRLAASSSSVALRAGRAVPGLRALHTALARPMERLGLLRRDWRWNPHMTLGYRRGEPFGCAVEPVAWENVDFVLLHSVVGRTRHIECGCWPLVARQGDLFA